MKKSTLLLFSILMLTAFQNCAEPAVPPVDVSASQTDVAETLNISSSSAANAKVGEVYGVIDEVTNDMVVRGWACEIGSDKSIDVHLYLSQPAGSKIKPSFVVYAKANLPSEKAVADECGAKGVAYRFEISLAAKRDTGQNVDVWVYGIATGNGPNNALTRSGQIRTPWLSTTTGLHKHFDPINGEHFYSTMAGEGYPRFAYEGLAFGVLLNERPGTISLYRCAINYPAGVNKPAHFVSLDGGCEGHTTEGRYGYIYAAQSDGNKPIYRLYQARTGDHLVSLDANEGSNAGYVLEGILGYTLH